jgi:nicotinamidase-related amidase
VLEKPALILIDVQREYFTRESPLWIPDGERVLWQLRELLETARESEVGVVHVQHHETPDSAVFATGTPNVETMQDVAPTDGEAVVRKHLPGSFDGTDLDSVLAGMNARSLVIGGFMTHMCCDTTAREAHARGFDVVFLTDGTATRDLSATSGKTIPHAIVHETTLAAQADGISTLMDVATARAELAQHVA